MGQSHQQDCHYLRQNSRFVICARSACTKFDALFFLFPTNLTICGGQNAGSTSLLVFMSAIGVVLNVDRQSRKSSI